MSKYRGQINPDGSFEMESVKDVIKAVATDDEWSHLKDITDMTPADYEKYGNWENWNDEIVCKSYFNSNLELVAKYATYRNYLKKVSVVKKYKNSFFKIGLKAEIALANAARAELREIAKKEYFENEAILMKRKNRLLTKKELEEKAHAEKIYLEKRHAERAVSSTTNNTTTVNNTVIMESNKANIKEVVEKTVEALLSEITKRKGADLLGTPRVQEPILFVEKKVA